MYFEIYTSLGQWRWRLKAANHRTIADSGEGYYNEQDCRHAMSLVATVTAATPIRRV